MKVTKTSELSFEVKIDQSERDTLDVVESMFEKPAEEVLGRSLEETMRQLELGTTHLVEEVTNKLAARRTR
jgi:hypothetical protein